MITVEEKTKSGSDEKEIVVTIDNGDFKVIDSLVDAYSFKDRQSLIKFAIGTLLEGNNNEGIFTIKTGEDNKRTLSKIAPSADMLKPKSE
ncbi:MAG: hypothetical protein A3G02_00180 [Candidatus Yanofskybacteria bacterium RIFCSPLOWO2_12_FULL_44_13b]|uniref:Uncharacterized protein n=1 Tax=Candidatus Yanofskybacteria bacterium RIFCSPLOWO2_02_FULL_44_18 TaxID=1802705 RepID=A0A1F8H0T3_9BACT|nr:MAG: hypothetical protein A2657_01025 [Candidatus Yanofskybacteria bacterium RIFCSPHIGHO2_01_FULL_44_110b]OGN15167.1 MAG: hypothetical protein A3C01_01850 [Candidatus Yanofskybacteria bacterium RIFCSPHIGHO2_02_FULL_44_36b]OGN18444.1 MAG: hypothetical protein A3F50_01440 [Candidatus Yanofskybacteria bacterium RIFCSPHIGHO2_12_FULL_44_29b]OGN31272.1 MAG: hypothetical protein A3I96_00465 [Candidatus Yanofskybacteria bacterium RIFCSPLOWO2_02_FULL_44_18]OGN35019.1 MAG: hypothetical protein A3G02_0